MDGTAVYSGLRFSFEYLLHYEFYHLQQVSERLITRAGKVNRVCSQAQSNVLSDWSSLETAKSVRGVHSVSLKATKGQVCLQRRLLEMPHVYLNEQSKKEDHRSRLPFDI